MGNLRISDFNPQFISLPGLVLDAPESIRMGYYTKALSASICWQAILRADWAQAQTLPEKMAITLLASQQLGEANGVSHSKHNHLPHTHQMVSVPHTNDSMEINTVHLSSNLPSFPRKQFIDECKRLKVCTRCLLPYNKTHRILSGSATCPNATAPLHAKVDFPKKSRAPLLPKHVPHPPPGAPQPVQHPVSAVGQTTLHPPPPHFPYQPQLWGHPPPPYPPFHYGYPGYPTITGPPPLPVPSHSTASSSAPPSQPLATILAVFSEYTDLSSPVYYGLPGADCSDTPRITNLPPTPPPVNHVPVTQTPPTLSHQISYMTFTRQSSTDSRLIIYVMLLSGKRLIHAKP